MRVSPSWLSLGGACLATAASSAVAAVSPKMASGNLLTAKRLIEAHRLDGLGLNPSHTRFLAGTTRYSFEKEKTNKALYVADVPSAKGQIEQLVAGSSDDDSHLKLISTKSSDGVWISDEELLYVDSDTKTLYIKHIDASSSAQQAEEHGSHVAILPVVPDSIKVAPGSAKGEATIVFSADVYADGDLTKVPQHDASDAVKEWEDVRAYDTTFVRHWDKWLYPGKRKQIFSVDLKRHSKAQWSLSSPYRNLLNGTALESPVSYAFDSSDYTVSETHVAFTSKDPDLNGALHTKHNIYLAPLKGGKGPKAINVGDHGASSSPSFSPKGTHITWLQMPIDGYESDRNRITIQHIPTGNIVTILPDWQLSPDYIGFSADGTSLVGTVEKEGQKVLFTIALHRGGSTIVANQDILSLESHEVVYRTKNAVVSNVLPLQGGQEAYILSASTIQGPGEVYLVHPDVPESRIGVLAAHGSVRELALTHFAQAKQSSLAGIDLGPVPEHFTYPGANGRDAYAWLVKPPGFDENAKGKYPLLMLAHGGPESAWDNSWSVRWNVLAYAHQGFVVVAPNPAGSTGYGHNYTREILGNLGGTPFEDVVLATRHIIDTVAAVDGERVVGAGASYGGFMMNWIQGHNEDKLFKGLVSHDGIFSLQGMFWATEELYFPNYEAGGPLSDPKVRESYLKWSPEKYAANWQTPMLVIHGGHDYRLTESEGLSCFNVLQTQGVPSRLLYFPKESHWVQAPKNSLRWHTEVFAWLHKYSGSTKAKETQESTGPGAGTFVLQKSDNFV